MSDLGSPEAMRTYMLRSISTAASNEKVLLYLESLQRAPPEEDDRASSVVSGGRRRGSVASSRRRLQDLAEEGADYGEQEDEEDIRSDVQEGNGSETARTIPIQTTGNPEHHEPGPNDPPGPHFESYGSSFGNFGPLPPAEAWNAPHSPVRPTGVPLPGSPTDSHPNPFQQWGMTPATAAGIPLPPSVASASVHPGAESPSSPMARSRHNASRASNKSPAPPASAANGMLSPKSASRALSPTRTGGGGERPWSPRTVVSQGQSLKSRATQKTNRTVYPPLPESVVEDNFSKAPTQRATSPVDRRTNKSPSIAPSDSPSQARSKRSTVKPLAKEPSLKPVKSVKSTTEINGGVAPSGGVSRYATSQRDARSQAPMSPRTQPSQVPMSPERSTRDLQRAAAAMSPTRSQRPEYDPQTTPTPSRPASPMDDLDADEQRMVNTVLTRPARSRTSYAPSTMAPSALEPEIQHSHFHDMELCQLLHALDQTMGEPVKKAVRKAVRARVKKLGMKNDNESIRQYRKSFHDHDPSVHLAAALQAQPSSKRSTQLGTSTEPPEWAKDLIDGMINMRDRLDSLAPKIERSLQSSRGDSYVTDGRGYPHRHHHFGGSEMDGAYTQTPMTQTVNINTQPTDTMGDESMFQPGDTDLIRDSTQIHTLPGSMHHHDGSMHDAIREEDGYDDEDDLHGHHMVPTDGDTHGMSSMYMHDRGESPGQQYLEEELYKLRVKPTGSQSAMTHKTWEVARDDGEDYDDGDAQVAVTESGMPEIPDGNTGGYTDRRGSPPLPPLPPDTRGDLVNMPDHQAWQAGGYGHEPQLPPPWQRIHQRLLSWAIVWPMSELDNAVNSATRGMQVDEVALSIWSTQTYKRYVRAKMTDSPPGRVDRLFVPPNMADAISTAVYNGRHGDACGMLRDLWAPFGLEGMPRLLIVLAKHRSDNNHWVVHRFSLPDGSLTTYDTYPERCLPDGRPLGWWFAIRIAWPDAIYPSPDHLMQKMVRLHRPMQLGIDNSVAAAGIWRNLLMGSRAERSLDLERLRDLINTEVKNLRQRKQMGKLFIGPPKPNWEDMN
ncbi:uncharacterized protein FIBRA_07947 [Fibroporia radiculosa]|uniref:Uncharacterized protein n=1 Tax=Fibroporia radiculosa TaxID=599839 RepID=J4GVW5_9APHY|nr:uncharacterized protein FIBRA_07947 [Fibroporia radiculosa]CCM05715.1 predicted protein [Fibroporia radiculosa]